MRRLKRVTGERLAVRKHLEPLEDTLVKAFAEIAARGDTRTVTPGSFLKSNNAQADLVSLIAGDLDIETLASRHGVTPEEAVRWREAFLAGMRASVSGQAMTRPPRHRIVMVAGALLATAAFAQMLVSFNPNEAAMASSVNGNFNLLKTWLEAKVGPVTNTNIVTSGNVTAANVTASGKLISASIAPVYGDWAALSGSFTGGAGIVNDNVVYKTLMVVGNTSQGTLRRNVSLYDDVFIGGDLLVPGNIWSGVSNDMPEARFSNSAAALTFTNCPAGKFVCGIAVGHASGDSQYFSGARIAVRCCFL